MQGVGKKEIECAPYPIHGIINIGANISHDVSTTNWFCKTALNIGKIGTQENSFHVLYYTYIQSVDVVFEITQSLTL